MPLNQKGFEYLKTISYSVFSTFDQHICKYINKNFSSELYSDISYHDFGRLTFFSSLLSCVSKWK